MLDWPANIIFWMGRYELDHPRKVFAVFCWALVVYVLAAVVTAIDKAVKQVQVRRNRE